MKLNAGCNLQVNVDAATPILLMLQPQSGLSQSVVTGAIEISPSITVHKGSDLFGNSFHRSILDKGQYSIISSCQVEVADQIDVDVSAEFTTIEDLPDEILLYLLPSRFCQSDLMLPLATRIIGSSPPGYQQVEAIRSWIQKKIKYKPGSSNATTSAVETAKNRKGVCRDFAHLGITLCRAIRIPARMVSGYLHELDPMDLHVWFEAFLGGRWYTFDPTQHQAKGNRIVIAYGRDIADVAFMTEFGPLRISRMETWVEPALA